MARLPVTGGRPSMAAMMDGLAARDRLAARMPMMGDEVSQGELPGVYHGNPADAPTLRAHLEQALADPERRDRRARTEAMVSQLLAMMKHVNSLDDFMQAEG